MRALGPICESILLAHVEDDATYGVVYVAQIGLAKSSVGEASVPGQSVGSMLAADIIDVREDDVLKASVRGWG